MVSALQMDQNSLPSETGHLNVDDLSHCADQSGSTEVGAIPTAAVWPRLDGVLSLTLSQAIAVEETVRHRLKTAIIP